MTTPLRLLLARYLPALEAELKEVLQTSGPSVAEYYDMMHYHMGWLDADLRPTTQRLGKRVRPVLCLLACEAAGGSLERALPAAAGLEILHNFSLVHDDVQDVSDLRRGRATVWKLWGQPHAINVGDGMFALAHLAFARLPERGVPVGQAFAALKVFTRTCLDLTHGQYLDLCFEDRLSITVDEYLNMIEGKTAALIAASSSMGALLAGASERTVDHYHDFGRHLGLAFQIQDDILGIWGDEGVTGKSTSTDIETRKKTLPIVYGLQHSPKLQRLYQNKAILPHQVSSISQTLIELGAREMAESLAAQHHAKAMHALQQSGAAGDAGQALRELAIDLLARQS